MNCKNCERVLDFLDEKRKGMCVGLIKKTLKKLPDDAVVLCFIKHSVNDRYLLKPSEALVIAAGLAGAFEAYMKKVRLNE